MGILGFAKPAHRLSSSAFCGRERCSNIKGASPEHRGTESFPRAFLQGGDGETQPRTGHRPEFKFLLLHRIDCVP